MGTLWNREPVMFLAVLQAAVALAMAFGLKLSATEIGAIMAFTAAVLGLITRSQVVPVAPKQ